MKPAIHVDKLSKQYHIGAHQKPENRTLRAALTRGLSSPLRRLQESLRSTATDEEKDDANTNGEDADTIWALKDISFEVEPGEVVGIIGANGSGKSTLMKVLSQVTTPTDGRVEVRGRVGSLLEVGTGFNHELSGRENIYLSAAILGMSAREIESKFEDIVAFAEIAKFLDTPIKHYSSGMQVRLGFAVAAHLDPEILLVDEALAVGDGVFQARCLARMAALAKSNKTVLFVSHELEMITRLCKRAMLLDKGRLLSDGPTATVVKEYLAMQMGADPLNSSSPESAPAGRAGKDSDDALHDLLAAPLEEPEIGPLATELTTSLLHYLPEALAEQLTDKLASPLAGYLADFLNGKTVEKAAPYGQGGDGTAAAFMKELQMLVTPPQPFDPTVNLGRRREEGFQFINYEDQPIGWYSEYLERANKLKLDVNDYLETELGWGDTRLLLQYSVLPYISENSVVTNLGAGTGRWARHLVRLLSKGELHLVDNDVWNIGFLRQYFRSQPRAFIHFDDGQSVPFPMDNAVDVYFSFGTFIAMRLGVIDLALQEIFRTLKPGGHCIIEYIDIDTPQGWKFLKTHGTHPAIFSDCYTYYTPSIIDRVFKSRGFEIVKRLHVADFYPNYPYTFLTVRKPLTAVKPAPPEDAPAESAAPPAPAAT